MSAVDVEALRLRQELRVALEQWVERTPGMFPLEDIITDAMPVVLALLDRLKAAEHWVAEFDALCKEQGLPVGTSLDRFVLHHQANAGLASAFDATSDVLELQHEIDALAARLKAAEADADQLAARVAVLGEVFYSQLTINDRERNIDVLNAHNAAVAQRGNQ